MIKIVFFVSTLGRSGTNTALYNIIQYLDRKLFEISILTISKEPANSRIDDFQALNVPVHSLNLDRIDSFFFSKRVFLRKVEMLAPDIIYSNAFRPDYLVAKYLGRKKIFKVSKLEANLYDNFTDTYGTIPGSLMAWLDYQYLSKFDVVIPCSFAIREKLKKNYKNIKVIRNGVDTDQFYPVDIEKKNVLREKLDLSKEKRIYISVGSLIRRKGPETIIKGFIQSNSMDHSLLLFLGDGPLVNQCKALAKDYPQIQFPGIVNNVSEYLQASDVLVSASHSEGLPNSVMEGGACGLFCCISDIPQHKEILDLIPQTGITFRTKSPDDLAKSIDQISFMDLENSKKERSDLMRKEFCASKMSSGFQEIFLHHR